MGKIKYDSLYSALNALNKAITGEEVKNADSTYTIAQNLMETLVPDTRMTTFSMRNGLQECNLTNGYFDGNKTYHFEEVVDGWLIELGYNGWNEVEVNVPVDVTLPDIEIVDWSKTLPYGDHFWFTFRPINDAFSVEAWMSGGCWWDSISNDDGTITYRDMNSTIRGEVCTIVNIEKPIWYDNRQITLKKHTYIELPYTLTDIPVDMPTSDSVLSEWGDPNQAIVCNDITEFLSMPDSTKENPQWYEFRARIQGAPQVESLTMVVNDDTLSPEYNVSGREGILINMCNDKLSSDSIWEDGNAMDIFPGDGSWCTIRTLKHTADQFYRTPNGDCLVREGNGFGGKFKDSPVAILIKDEEE